MVENPSYDILNVCNSLNEMNQCRSKNKYINLIKYFYMLQTLSKVHAIMAYLSSVRYE